MASPNFSVLLPPAEGKRAGGNPYAPDMFDYRSSNAFNFFSELNTQRRALIDALHDAMEDEETDLEKLFGLKEGPTLEEALRVNENIYQAPLMPAWERYRPGVMYEAVDFPGLPTGAQRRLLENGLIISGLFGLLRPDDLIPNYRLKIDAKLPEVGRVSDFWRPLISPLLNRVVKGRTVWNFLPQAHQRAWEDEQTYKLMVDFKLVREETPGEREPITHGVKPLRGHLVNLIVSESLETVEGLLKEELPDDLVVDREALDEQEGQQITVTLIQYLGEAKEAYAAKLEKERAEREAARLAEEEEEARRREAAEEEEDEVDDED